MFFINTILETLFNMLKRLDCRKDALNYNHFNFKLKYPQLGPEICFLVSVKMIKDSKWKLYM